MSQASAVLPAFARRGAKVFVVPAVAGAATVAGVAAPAQAAPVQTAPVQSAPVQSAPVQSAPIAAAPAPAAPRTAVTLRRGTKSAAVLAVQRKLGVRPTTGFFGRKTQAAVIKVQRANRLPVTGRVDSRTWQAIFATTSRGAAASAATATDVSESASRGSRNYRAYRAALTRAGSRYVWGGEGPRTFDCSGLVVWAYRQVGKQLPHSSRMQRSITRRVSRPAVGDLVFVHNRGGGRVSHVAFYAGNGNWFEAANPRRPIGTRKGWSKNVSYGRVG